MQKLLSRSKFAQEAGVNPSTVTRLCETILKAAVCGKKIDASHPDAIKYLESQERKRTVPVAPGIDPLYEYAILECEQAGKYTASFIQEKLRMSFPRAKNILETMKKGGLVPEKGYTPDPIVLSPERSERVVPKLRGQAAVKARKKQEVFTPTSTLEIPEDIQEFADMTLRDLVGKFGTDVRFLDWLKATKAIEDINEKRLKNAQTKGELVSRELVRTGVIEQVNAANIKMLTDGAKTIARRVTAMNEAGRDLKDIEEFIKDQLSSFIRPMKTKISRNLKNA